MNEETPTNPPPEVNKRSRRLSSRIMILVRRIHLYTGLFLLPWVFLFGITGAVYNHQNLFPSVKTEPVPVAVLEQWKCSKVSIIQRPANCIKNGSTLS